MVAHLVAICDPMQEFQHLHQHADSMFLLGTPGDARVCFSGKMQSEVIGIECHHDPFCCQGERELIGVGLAAAPGVLSGLHVDAALPKSVRHGVGEVLIHEEANRFRR